MKWKGLILATVAALSLAACGDNTATTEQPKSEQTSQVKTNSEQSDYPKTFTDGRGKEVVIEKKPTRIVSTTLAVDEYLMSIADESNILAVTQMSTDPTISNVAGQTNAISNKLETITAEQILALDPDLVIIPGYVDSAVLDQIDDAGITTYQIIDESSFESILETVTTIGEIIGEEERAEALLADIEQRMNTLKENAAKQETKKRVLYYTDMGSSVTENTTIGQMIDLAGGINVVAEAGIVGDAFPDYPTLSKEALIELNPEIIVTTVWGNVEGEPAFITELKNDPALVDVDAIKNNKIFVLDGANVTTASHFVIEGAEEVYSIITGE